MTISLHSYFIYLFADFHGEKECKTQKNLVKLRWKLAQLFLLTWVILWSNSGRPKVWNENSCNLFLRSRMGILSQALQKINIVLWFFKVVYIQNSSD